MMTRRLWSLETRALWETVIGEQGVASVAGMAEGGTTLSSLLEGMVEDNQVKLQERRGWI